MQVIVWLLGWAWFWLEISNLFWLLADEHWCDSSTQHVGCRGRWIDHTWDLSHSPLWEQNADPLYENQGENLTRSHRAQTFVTMERRALHSEPHKCEKAKWREGEGESKLLNKRTNELPALQGMVFFPARRLNYFLIASQMYSDKSSSKWQTSAWLSPSC